MKENIYSLYVLKAVCAFAIVTCHIPFIGNSTFIMGLFHSISVPIFFMISGYFLYSENNDKFKKNLYKSLKKIIQIFFAVNIIYMTALYFNHGLIIKSLYDFIILVFHGNGHLWYLSAYIEALLFFVCLSKLKLTKYKYLYICLSLLFILSIIYGRYKFLVGNPSVDIFNFLFQAVPCFSVGCTIRQFEEKMKITWFYLILIVMGFYIEYTLLSMNGNNSGGPYLFFTFPVAVSFILFCLKWKFFGKNTFIATIGYRDSGNIYYFHVLIGSLILLIFNKFGKMNIYFTEFGAIYVFVVAVCISFFIKKIQDKIGIKIL